MELACLDLEGVLVPEIWVAFAKKTGIDVLKQTTRDCLDYEALMYERLQVLDKHGLRLNDIQHVVESLEPLPGACEFLYWLQERFQVMILSDTFYELCQPLMQKLGFPTLLCHHLNTDNDGRIIDILLRQSDAKRQAVLALQGLNYRVIAAGDSYNDITMLQQADSGILFNAPDYISNEFPLLPSTANYEELKEAFISSSKQNLAP